MAGIQDLSDRILKLSIEIEDIERSLIQLQLRKDELEAERAKLRKKRDRQNRSQDIANWRVGANMALDLLKKKVGDDFDLLR